jgi:NlpC/P60 family
MKFSFKLALVLLSLWTAMPGPVAKAQADDDSGNSVLVSADQGQALADFALRSGRRIRPKPDCSHLVHLLYARAGLIYAYEDSRVLYRGVNDFERVKTPQPGDLIVWLGHVGIVLSPEENTFVSSVHSGILTESWTAAHWVHRGRPRFYRYRIGPAADMSLLAAIMGDAEPGQNENHGDVRSSASTQLPLPAADQPASKTEDDGLQAKRDDPLAHDALREPRLDGGNDSGSIVAVIAQRQTPGKQQIAAAMMESSKARARRLIGGETLNLDLPVTVFDRLEVEKIKIKHENGLITLRLSETLSQEAGRSLSSGTRKRELSIVRRSDGIWAVIDPQARTYISHADALNVFERQAELFLQHAPNSSGTRAVVKALDRLYDQEVAGPQRAAIR